MARSPRDRGSGAVRKLPSGRWQARMLVNGKHVSLGSYAQKADANAALRDALGQQDAGTWVDPRGGRVSFGTSQTIGPPAATTWRSWRRDPALGRPWSRSRDRGGRSTCDAATGGWRRRRCRDRPHDPPVDCLSGQLHAAPPAERYSGAGRQLAGQRLDLDDCLGRKRSGSGRPLPVLQAIDAFLEETLPPTVDPLGGGVETGGDLLVLHAVGSQQHDPCSLHPVMRPGVGTGAAPQDRSLLVAQS